MIFSFQPSGRIAFRRCFKNVSIHLVRNHHDEIVRTRFAPSPTGFLHIGSLRTALYNYLFARKHKNGKFIVRIEDTDQSRLVPGATKKLFEVLKWAGISADEDSQVGGDFGPYTQSSRLHLYRQYAYQLIENKKAYRCFCSPRRLAILKQEQNRNNEKRVGYDNRCRHLSEEQIKTKLMNETPYTIRLAIEEKNLLVEDILFQKIYVNPTTGPDPVILKSDGYATYHLANVVDDHLMQITHVIRGKEWFTSLPQHLLIYQAFGWTPPKFCHVPLLMNSDGKKLSKRYSDVFVETYIQKSYTAPSLINFVLSCGGGFPQGTFPMLNENTCNLLNDLAEKFNLEKLSRVNARVNFDKLNEYSYNLLRNGLSKDSSRLQLCEEVKNILAKSFPDSFIFTDLSTEQLHLYIDHVLNCLQDRLPKLNDLVSDEFSFLWYRPNDLSLGNSDQFHTFLCEFSQYVKDTSQDDEDFLVIGKKIVKKHSKEIPAWKTLRLVLTGAEKGVPVFMALEILSKKETLTRFENAIKSVV